MGIGPHFKKSQGKNIMACPITYGGHKYAVPRRNAARHMSGSGTSHTARAGGRPWRSRDRSVPVSPEQSFQQQRANRLPKSCTVSRWRRAHYEASSSCVLHMMRHPRHRSRIRYLSKKFANFNEFSEIKQIRKKSYKNSLNARV